MPTATKPRPKKAAPKQSADGAVERVSESLEAAQKALNAVRGDVSKGTRDLKANVERLISDARRDVAKLGKSVHADLEEFKKNVTGPSGHKPKPPGKRRA